LNIFKLIIKEISYRKFNFIASTIAVAAASAIFTAFLTANSASYRETTRIMRNMGQNLKLIPAATSMDQFWTDGFSSHTMPEENVQKFTKLPDFSYTHLTATLQQKIQYRDMEIILVGVLPEVYPIAKQHQSPMAFNIGRNDVYVGFDVAENLNMQQGREINILGKKFNVVKKLSQTGTSDDIRVFAHLHDVQSILNMPGRINEIKALECLCSSAKGEDFRQVAQEKLHEFLPDVKVILMSFMAKVRKDQREMMQRYLSMVLPVLIITCCCFLGVLTMNNVKQRQQEIGILVSVGFTEKDIGLTLLSKSVIIGIIGGIAGFFIGSEFVVRFGPEIFQLTGRSIQYEYSYLKLIIIFAPLLAIVSALIPAAIAVSQDTASILREQ
jgi:putative ABC transport system permease protein